MKDLLARDPSPVLRPLARPGTLVVLDFDGTLAPIVRDRRRARLTRRSRAALEAVARTYPVAVLSGRGAADVRDRVEGADVRWIVGSHGAEWPGEEARHRAWIARLDGWQAALARRLEEEEGIEIERKPMSLAVHFRHSPRPREAERLVLAAAGDIRGPLVIPGKMVVNLVPAGAGDKGTALRRLVTSAGAERVLFVGDDATDEVAFRAELGVPAVMVRVGQVPGSGAEFFVRRRGDVDVLLERLASLRGARTLDHRPPARAAPAGHQGLLGPVLAFMKDLWALEQGLNQRSHAMLRQHGVSGPQRLLVMVVGRLGAVGQAELARILHLHPSSVLRLIRKLERRRLVRRIPDPTHRGRFVVELGSKGARVERLDEGTVESAIRSTLSTASRPDLEATTRVISELVRRLLEPRGERHRDARTGGDRRVRHPTRGARLKGRPLTT